MSTTQEFTTQIIQTAQDGTEVSMFPSLAASITSWERDWDEEDEDEDEDEDVGTVDDEQEGAESEDEDEDDDEFLVADSDGSEVDGHLRMTTLVTAEAMRDLKDLQSSRAMYKIRFNYGDVLRREFDIDNTGYLALNSGTKSVTPLEAVLYFDVYGSDTKY